MSDDKTKPPASPLSTPLSTASLDDVLSSLEQQVKTETPAYSTTTIPPVEPQSSPVLQNLPTTDATLQPVQGTPPVSDPVAIPEQSISSPPSKPTIEIPPIPVAPVEAVVPVATPEVASFGIEEKHVDASPIVSAVPATSSVTSDALREHPTMKTDTALPIQSTVPDSVSEKRSGLFGISFNPKVAIAGVIALFLIVGSVAAFMLSQTGQDLRQQATSGGCKINYDGTNSFTLSGCSGTITKFNGPACPTTTEKVAEESAHDGKYEPAPPSGKCQQVDHNFSGTDDSGKPIGPGGVCRCAEETGPSCRRNHQNICRFIAVYDATKPNVDRTTMMVGETKKIISDMFANGQVVGIRWTSSDPSILTVGPNKTARYERNICCGFTYGQMSQSPYKNLGDVDVQALKPGKVILKIEGIGGEQNAGTCESTCFEITVTAPSPSPTPSASPSPSPSPTPTPSASPSPSPSPTPTPPPLACLKVTRDIASPKVGNQVRFTCGLVAGANRYEFRYKHSFNGGPEVGGTLTATNNLSAPLTIEHPGTYKVQCRVCVGQACSEWEQW